MSMKLSEQITAAYNRVRDAHEQARKDLEEIVKNAGGFIKTLKGEDDYPLRAKMYGYYDDNADMEDIYGIRYIEGEGLYICTESMAHNYEYDSGYKFDYLSEIEEGSEDAENMDKMLDDTAYYIDIYEDYVDTAETVIEILAGLSAYVD